MHACTHLLFKELKIAFLYSSIDSFEARRADNLEKEALCNITYLCAEIVKIVDVLYCNIFLHRNQIHCKQQPSMIDFLAQTLTGSQEDPGEIRLLIATFM